MKHFFKKPLILFATALLAWSCSDDDDNNGGSTTPEQNIVEAAQATTDLSSLVAALTAADQSPNNDLIGTLSGEGPFTVLAPSNEAFSDLFDRLDGFSSLADFDTTEEQDLLAAILAYHVVSGAAVTSGMLTNGQTIETVQGGTLTVSTEGGFFFTDAANEAAQVTTPDEETSNGVVHIINKVLLPQAAIDALNGVLLFSITDLAISNPNLSSLVAALQAANGDLPDILRGDGPFTVLAPTDAAFNTFLDGAQLGDIDTEVLTQVLLNHVISGEIESSTLVAAGTGYASTSAAGPIDDTFLSIFYNATDGVRFNGVSSVVPDGADIKAINGIVHVVDAVIDLPNIVDHATANSEFDNLVGALTDEGNTVDFVSVLSGTEEVYTVFAPVNAAFDAFTNPGMNPLQDILLNHVVSGDVILESSLSTGYDNVTMASFAEGEFLSLYVNTDADNTFNGVSSPVMNRTDIVATNGVIHAVDAVIDLPTVVTFAVADPTFDSLQAALTTEGQPDFVGTLSADGPFTVFAPTNDAFQALLDSNDMWDGLTDIDSGLLTSVLQHHVVEGNIRSGDLTNPGNTPAPTLEGDNITITLPGTGDNIADVTDGSGIDDIGITFVDVQANNGVIHVLNKVLIPNTTN
ncbi:fasciclin domain-containing protein [Muricauda sp. SCSIO 64092]|uniref:fasciclin domain-containing protein n=1 Tax=Allomuricauda sp. SCSIO 64092 TaxID=2908842 RepID=UPI001FF4E0D3|nr:fasciclin domain-containing protein [Muricauda sp. SCSIO 64092]UOY05635.1 fasciclin domain-containing protein [Muricauda sp. SCSIO 64092]